MYRTFFAIFPLMVFGKCSDGLLHERSVGSLMVKGARVCAAVAGSPVDHSLTPFLFRKVAQFLQGRGHTITFDTCERITHDNIVNAMAWGHAAKKGISLQDEGADLGKREIWLSLTSPLKHQLPVDSGATWTIGDALLASVNQMRHDGHVWRAANSDGPGLLMVANHFGFDFSISEHLEKPLLCMVGGGSTARACAGAWAEAGGVIWWKSGRRRLSQRGPWRDSMIEASDVCDHIGRRLHIDFDQEPGLSPTVEGERIEAGSDAPLFLSASYSDEENEITIENEWGIHLSGRWLLAAQHLEAWRHLFFPEVADELPSLMEAMEWLNDAGE